MKPTVLVFEPVLFDGSVADEIVAAALDAVEEQGNCSISLAGGSTPAGVYRSLARPPRREQFPWKSVRFFLGDERWVPVHDTQSNFRMVEESLLGSVANEAPQAFPCNTSAKTPELGAAEYAALLQSKVKESKNGIPVIDLVLLGLGEDGHTASIFPGSRALEQTNKAYVAVHDGTGVSARLSLSPEAICAAKNLYFIVKGASKAEIVKQIISGDGDVSRHPARIFLKASGKVTFLLDSAAASQLRVEGSHAI